MSPPVITRAVVVFGAAVGVDGEPRTLLRERLRVARELALADADAVIVVSGGSVRGRPAEGPAMARWLRANGIPAGRILVEPAARTTVENADRVIPLLRSLAVRRATIVTQPFHAPRARRNLAAALRAAGFADVALDVAPAADPRRGAACALARAVEVVKSHGDRAARTVAALRRHLGR